MTDGPLWLTAAASEDNVTKLADAMNLPRRVARWLVARNIVTEDEARRFLFAREQWTNPFDYHDMDKAAECIRIAIEESKTIVVVGDYDVDGVTASAIVATELELLGAKWACMIPDRVDDGYGISATLVERAEALGAGLIITVDNGIQAYDAMEVANQRGIPVVLTDHHEPGSDTLACHVIVHWSRHQNPNRAKLLSGAGVAWKLTQALGTKFPQTVHPADHAEWLSGLAAIGAVSDMMPVRGENRRLIREGLANLAKVRRPGWLALCEQSNVDGSAISAAHVSWRIAPRLNAAGRLASAEVAFRLFMTAKRAEASELAREIEQINSERRTITESVTNAAVAQVLDVYGETPPSAIVVYGDWPLGVVGIVAARLVNKFTCPVIVLCDGEDDVLRGSGRAPDGCSLYDLMQSCDGVLHHFGGHDAAVGCGVRRDQIEAFRAAFTTAAETAAVCAAATTKSAVLADDYLPLDEVTLEILDFTQSFSPFGPENSPLQFFVGPVKMVGAIPLGNGSHIRLRLREGKTQMDAIWFQVPESAREAVLNCRSSVALLVELEENVWRGVRKPQLRVVRCWQVDDAITRDAFAIFYRHLLKLKRVSRASFEDVAVNIDAVADDSGAHAMDKMDVILKTFVELEFAAMADAAYHLLEDVQPRDLRDALSYQAHLRANLSEFR